MNVGLCSRIYQKQPILDFDQHHLVAARLASLADPIFLKADSSPHCPGALSFGGRQHPNSG